MEILEQPIICTWVMLINLNVSELAPTQAEGSSESLKKLTKIGLHGGWSLSLIAKCWHFRLASDPSLRPKASVFEGLRMWLNNQQFFSRKLHFVALMVQFVKVINFLFLSLIPNSSHPDDSWQLTWPTFPKHLHFTSWEWDSKNQLSYKLDL